MPIVAKTSKAESFGKENEDKWYNIKTDEIKSR